MVFYFFCCNFFVCISESQNNNYTVKDPDSIKYSTEFSFPFGNGNGGGVYTCVEDKKTYSGWYIGENFCDQNKFGIHPGEDWNGNGGGNTDALQPVYSVSNGKVIEIQTLPFDAGEAIKIEHLLKNTFWEIDTIYSVYVHLHSVIVKKGDYVSHRQKIGNIFKGNKFLKAHLHIEIRKVTTKHLPLLYYPSLDGKDIKWIKENYFKPSKFINAYRKKLK